MKLRKHAANIALVVVAALAGVGVLVVDRGSVTTRESTLRKKNLFAIWRADDITHVTIRSGARAIELVRGAPSDAGQRPWRITVDGTGFDADEQAVDQLFGSLEFATFERSVGAGGVDRHAFGLDAPRRSFAIDMGTQRLELAIGGPAPSPEGAAYAEVPGRGVFVVAKQLVAALEIDADALRSRSFVPYFSDDLSALWIDGEGGARHLERAGDESRFRFDGSTPEGKVRANRVAVERALTALGDMQATAFPSEADATRALTKEVVVTFVPSDASRPRGVIELGGACPGRPDDIVAIRRAPSVLAACVPSATVEPLELDASDFVDHHVVQAPIDEVTEVKLTEGNSTIEIARSGNGWHERAPADTQLDAEVGRSLVAGLLDAEGRPSADAVFDATDVRGLVHVASTPARHDPSKPPVERIEEIAIGREHDGQVLAKRTEDGAVLVLDAAAARMLLPRPLALRQNRVFDVKESAVRSLHVVAGPREQRLDRTATGGWTLVEPSGEGMEADIGFAADVVQAMGSLNAVRWVAEEDDGTHGLDSPRLHVDLDVADAPADGGPGRTSIAVDVGAGTTDGSFARVVGERAVFVAPKTLEAVADRWLLARTALTFDVADVKTVALRAPGAPTLEVVQGAAGWTTRAGGADAAARGATVRDSLEDLMTEGAVSVGPPEASQGFTKPSLEIIADRGDAPKVRIVFGAGDVFHGTNVIYARRDGIDATYAVAQAKVRMLLEAVRAR